MTGEPNKRPCGACRHLDPETLPSGVAYCWRFYVWRPAGGTVPDCTAAERPDGGAPPGKVWFDRKREST